MKRALVFFLAFAFTLAFGAAQVFADGSGSAAPQPAIPDVAADPGGFVKYAYDAATSGRWKVVAGLALLGAAYAVRRWVFGRVAWFQTRIGGFVLALGLALLGTFGAALAAGAAVTPLLALEALGTAATAAGAWAWLQHVLEPKQQEQGGN